MENTYKTTSALLYLLPVSFKSVFRPNSAALEMFTLVRVEQRHFLTNADV